jgi:hypothetical protein
MDRVLICSPSGFAGMRFTVPGSMIAAYAPLIPSVGPLVTLAAVVGGLLDKYIIFFGRDGYRNALDSLDGQPSGAVFIHELTHVWQGHNNAFPWSYVGNSIAMQCVLGRGQGSHQGAYAYVPGNQWSKYQAEQQAMIVQDWYSHREAPANHSLPPKGILPPPQFIPEPDSKSTSFSIAVNERLFGTTISQVYQAYMDCNVSPGHPYAATVFPQQHPFKDAVRPGMIFKKAPGIQTSLMTPVRKTNMAAVFAKK